MPAIYEAIREALERSEKTRYRLSQETGISQTQLSEFLHGRRGMSVENIELLIEALGLEVTIRPARRKRG